MDQKTKEGFNILNTSTHFFKQKCHRHFLSLTGFTLIELFIAMAIIAMLMGVLVPRLNVGIRIQRLESDARELASNIALAQSYATGQKDSHRYCGIYFFSNKGYRIVPYDNPPAPLTPFVVPSSINENGDISFSKDVTISNTVAIIFDYRGSLTSAGDAQRTLSLGTINMTITVRKLTGAVELSK